MKKLIALSLIVVGCTATTPVVYGVEVTRDIAFTDSLDLDTFAPIGHDEFPVVVLFHGGSWYGGERTDVEDFARLLASKGLVVYNATYTVGGAGGGYPQSYEDIRCALTQASELSRGAPLTVVGYSAGAHLASTVALSGEAFKSDKCTSAATVTLNGFVGLAGPYEADRYGPLLASWFGNTLQTDPDRWTLGGPYGYLATAAKIPFVLVHGDQDQVVQLGFSDDFDRLLVANDFEVSYDIIEGADHATIVDPLADGPAVADVIFTLASLASD
ncbi:MAG: lysophospholipase [Acidimicrobiia bacterium]|nr:lysophospholipase [Acidimicrobiia bacterium]MDH5502727.1 lysophospholipase [Acidimicrobiia bacterium]